MISTVVEEQSFSTHQVYSTRSSASGRMVDVMKRTAMELAALASAAMPGLDIVQTSAAPDDTRAFDSAIVTDTDNNHWRVRSPRNSQAAFRLETEIQVLSGFTPAIRAHLPFRVPSVAGAVQIDSLRTFIYHQMPGQPVDLDTITGSEPQTIDDIGRIVAAIHKLPRAVVETADLPSYGAEQLRSRLLSELDQIALTGKVPSALLRRWESAFEERRMWSFTPRVVHGDFDETSLLIDRNRAVGVTAWTDLHIGDPAQDFTWLASTESLEFREALLSAYHQHMDLPADQLDLHIMRRAALAAEFSLAKYLMSGINTANNEVIDEAQAMLDDLASDVETTGGQDIGQKFWEPEPTPEPSASTTAPTAPVESESAIFTDNDVQSTETGTLDDAEDDVESEHESAVASEETPTDGAADTEPEPDTQPVPRAVPSSEAAEESSRDDAEELTQDSPALDDAEEELDELPEPQRPEAEDDGTTLVVHSLSDEDKIVRHDEPTQPAATDVDTQPISWKTVKNNLNDR